MSQPNAHVLPQVSILHKTSTPYNTGKKADAITVQRSLEFKEMIK